MIGQLPFEFLADGAAQMRFILESTDPIQKCRRQVRQLQSVDTLNNNLCRELLAS